MHEVQELLLNQWLKQYVYLLNGLENRDSEI